MENLNQDGLESTIRQLDRLVILLAYIERCAGNLKVDAEELRSDFADKQDSSDFQESARLATNNVLVAGSNVREAFFNLIDLRNSIG